jgi:hypothetical protein
MLSILIHNARTSRSGRPRQAKVIIRELFIALFVRILEKRYVFKGDERIPIHFYPDLFSGVGGGGGIY